MKVHFTFPELLQRYFTDRLTTQRNASPNTIASQRDTFRLLLGFAQRSLHKSPSALAIEDFDAPFIGRFLDYLEKDRRNSPRSRNVRLAAIHSFFRRRLMKPGPAISGGCKKSLKSRRPTMSWATSRGFWPRTLAKLMAQLAW